ncbi:hypothetical protein THAOC_23487, partial [Thalassiosira oceanica]
MLGYPDSIVEDTGGTYSNRYVVEMSWQLTELGKTFTELVKTFTELEKHLPRSKSKEEACFSEEGLIGYSSNPEARIFPPVFVRRQKNSDDDDVPRRADDEADGAKRPKRSRGRGSLWVGSGPDCSLLSSWHWALIYGHNQSGHRQRSPSLAHHPLVVESRRTDRRAASSGCCLPFVDATKIGHRLRRRCTVPLALLFSTGSGNGYTSAFSTSEAMRRAHAPSKSRTTELHYSSYDAATGGPSVAAQSFFSNDKEASLWNDPTLQLIDLEDIFTGRDVYSMEEWCVQNGVERIEGIQLYTEDGADYG